MSANRYGVCGLTLESELPLPELPAADGAADSAIRLGTVPADGPDHLTPIGPLTRADCDNLWLKVPGVARFWVREGREVLVDPEPGCDEGALRSLLLASPLAALLFQRDQLVMHGNAVAIDGQALLLLGASGSGKSTVAAQFMQRGHRLLADDVLALDGSARVLPGVPRLKLWRNALKQLGIPRDNLVPVHAGVERYGLPFDAAVAAEPLPVRWVVILVAANREEFELAPLRGMHRFMPLRRHTYRVSFMDHMGLKARHMAQIATLSPRIGLWVLAYPGHGDHAADLAGRILDTIARDGT